MKHVGQKNVLFENRLTHGRPSRPVQVDRKAARAKKKAAKAEEEMTCEEFKAAIMTKMTDCSNAVLGAAFGHYHDCGICRLWFDVRVGMAELSGATLSPEDQRMVDRRSIEAQNDPETGIAKRLGLDKPKPHKRGRQ